MNGRLTDRALMDGAEPFSGRAVIAFAIILIAIFSFSFIQNNVCLMLGLDGNWYRTMFANEALDRLRFSQTGADALTGGFDAWYPLSPEYLLPHALALLVSAAPPTKPFIFTVFSIFMAVSIYAVASAVQAGRAVALAAGLLMPILAGAGLVGKVAQLFPLFEANPYWFQCTGLGCLIVAAFWRLDSQRSIRTALLIVAPTLCLMLAIISEAPHVLFMVPIVGAYAAGSFLTVRRVADLGPRILAGSLMIVTPALLGVFTYYYGILGYAAYRFFPNEIQHPLGGSIAFSTLLWSRLGACVILLGLAGAFWAALAGTGRLRLFAVTHLIASVLYFAVAYWMAFLATGYRSSWPVYFETGIWPFALIFSVIAVASALRFVLSTLGAASIGAAGMASDWLRRRSAAVVLSGVCVAIATYNIVPRQNLCVGADLSHIRETAITAVLQKNIALRPGALFRGMVATIDGMQPGKPGDWIDFYAHDVRLYFETGNDHRTIGLWHFDIPTLLQNQTFLTPPYYLLLTDFLSAPDDHQLRSQLVLTRIDPTPMMLWGVRYVITDTDAQVGHEVARLPTAHFGTLRLLELNNPNLGNYSPTDIVHADDFAGALRVMHQASFDGGRTLVTMAAGLDQPLVPARQAQLVYTKQGFHLTAESDGHSVLVLPAQYSHCWTAEGTGNPALFRADAMQLGVSFSGRLDAHLIFRLGPLLAGQCRVEDLRDMERLGIDRARSVPR